MRFKPASAFMCAPSATAIITLRAPTDFFSATKSHSLSSEKGISGIKIASAPAASPEWRASHPALLPIISTSITRAWLSAVVRILSIQSVATSTAV